MANGTFLVSLLIGDRPSLVKFTCKHGDPVVQVEHFNPCAEDLHPSAAFMLGDNAIEPYLSKTISQEIEKLGQEAWAEVLAKNGEPTPKDWNAAVKHNVSKFLESQEIAQRLTECLFGTAMNKEQVLSVKHLEGTSQLERSGGLGSFLNYVTDPNNVWHKDAYLANRRMSGTVFGTEAAFSYMYVLGNAFMEGHIGDTKVRIYYLRSQNFQIYTVPLVDDIREPDLVPVTFHPDNKAGVLTYFENLLLAR